MRKKPKKTKLQDLSRLVGECIYCKEKIYSDYAFVDTRNDKITLEKNVKYENNIGTIVADLSIIENNFSQISYSGNVKSSIKVESK